MIVFLNAGNDRNAMNSGRVCFVVYNTWLDRMVWMGNMPIGGELVGARAQFDLQNWLKDISLSATQARKKNDVRATFEETSNKIVNRD
jgi:hypothetical protein